MTVGGKRLRGNESLYDVRPVLLFDRFLWADREKVLQAVETILAAGGSRWRFGGAYLFWAQREDGTHGEVLYVGETEGYVERLTAHLMGPATDGNQHALLSERFGGMGAGRCGLALFVIAPEHLPVLEPPDEDPTFENGVAKRAGEALEALFLRAHVNWRRRLPVGNCRKDEAKADHDHETYRFQSAMKLLSDVDDGDVTLDFMTFIVRDEEDGARRFLLDGLDRCLVLRKPTA